MQYSIVNLSEVKNASNDFLLHAEFFAPKILNFRKYAKENNFKKIGDYIEYIKNGVQPDYNLNGTIEVVRPTNIRESEITSDRQEFVAKEFYDNNKKGQIKFNDVLLTASGVGTLGRAAIYKSDKKKFLSVDNIILRNSKDLLPEFLYVFLNSKYGQSQINVFYKGTSGIIHLYPDDIKQILIKPLKIQQKIADLVNTSYSLRQSADTLYKQAEDELLQELGLKDYVPSNKKCFVKNLSEVEAAARFDAEYFQPKYEVVIEKIRGYKGGCFCFEDKDIKDKNFAPVDDVKYKYIELANINSNSSIDNVNTIAGSELPTRARRRVKENDLIVSSVEGSLSSIALIMKKFDDALCSTGFYVVNCDKISSESLLVFLKSEVGQMQLKKGCSGTILSAISKDEFKKVLIPNLSQSIQQSISSKIQQSFANREKSLQLLELAKKSVEVAIEEGEDEAMKLKN